MPGMKRMSTTSKAAAIFRNNARKDHGSTKRSKPAQARVYGSSSQFSGVRVGKKGDPRK